MQTQFLFQKRLGDRPAGRLSNITSSLVRGVVVAGFLLFALVFLSIAGGNDSVPKARWTFIDMPAIDDAGFALDRDDQWRTERRTDATGGWALVNPERAGSEAPAVLVARRAPPRESRITTRCRVDGRVSDAAACGLVYGYRDRQNYGSVRLAAESEALDVVLTRDGAERILQRIPVRGTRDGWNEISAVVKGKALRVEVNGQPIAHVRAAMVADRGTAGLWASARGLVAFDELAIEALRSVDD
jgi:hypothetical protein